MEERNSEFVATSWEPYEISVVSQPADLQIGVGRSLLPDPIIAEGSAEQARLRLASHHSPKPQQRKCLKHPT